PRAARLRFEPAKQPACTKLASFHGRSPNASGRRFECTGACPRDERSSAVGRQRCAEQQRRTGGAAQHQPSELFKRRTVVFAAAKLQQPIRRKPWLRSAALLHPSDLFLARPQLSSAFPLVFTSEPHLFGPVSLLLLSALPP